MLLLEEESAVGKEEKAGGREEGGEEMVDIAPLEPQQGLHLEPWVGDGPDLPACDGVLE